MLHNRNTRLQSTSNRSADRILSEPHEIRAQVPAPSNVPILSYQTHADQFVGFQATARDITPIPHEHQAPASSLLYKQFNQRHDSPRQRGYARAILTTKSSSNRPADIRTHGLASRPNSRLSWRQQTILSYFHSYQAPYPYQFTEITANLAG